MPSRTTGGFEVANAYVSISPNLEGFRRTLRRELDASLRGAMADPMRQEMARTEAAVRPGISRIGSTLSTTLKAAITAGAAGAAAGLAGLTALSVIGVRTASDLQQAQVAYTTMIGNAETAKKTLADLMEFARTSPFDTTQVVAAGKQLLAYGFDASQLIPILTTLGDAASATGLGAEGINRLTVALGQIRAKGRVQAQELLQLQETGIPATQILADSLGKTQAATLDLVEKGLVPADFAIQALLNGMSNGTATVRGFGGLMQEQAKTLAGTWSNFKDSVKLALADGLQPYLQPLAASLNALIPSVEGFARAFGSALGPTLSALATTIGPALAQLGAQLGPAVGQLVTALGPVFATLAPVLGDIATHFADIASAVLSALQPALDTLAPVMQELYDALAPAVKDVLVALAPTMGVLAQAIAEVARQMIPLIPPLTDLIVAVLPLLTPLLQTIVPWILNMNRAFAALGSITIQVAQVALVATRFILDAVISLVAGTLDVLARLPGSQGDLFAAQAEVVRSLGTTSDATISAVLDKSEALQASFEALAQGYTIPVTVTVNSEDEGLPRPRNAQGEPDTATTPTTPTTNSAAEYWRREYEKLRALTKAQGTKGSEATKTAADAAKRALESWKQEVAQFAQGVRDTITSFGAITAFSSKGLFAPTAAQITADMRARVAKARAFFPLVRRLSRLGLNRASLLEIIQAGPTAGSEIAQALLAGGAGAIAEVNKLESDLIRSGRALGAFAAGVKFDGTQPAANVEVGVDVYLDGQPLKALVRSEIASSARAGRQAAARGSRTA